MTNLMLTEVWTTTVDRSTMDRSTTKDRTMMDRTTAVDFSTLRPKRSTCGRRFRQDDRDNERQRDSSNFVENGQELTELELVNRPIHPKSPHFYIHGGTKHPKS
jgi:hypothetical protein